MEQSPTSPLAIHPFADPSALPPHGQVSLNSCRPVFPARLHLPLAPRLTTIWFLAFPCLENYSSKDSFHVVLQWSLFCFYLPTTAPAKDLFLLASVMSLLTLGFFRGMLPLNPLGSSSLLNSEVEGPNLGSFTLLPLNSILRRQPPFPRARITSLGLWVHFPLTEVFPNKPLECLIPS